MTAKRLVLRPIARRDINSAAAYYASEAGPQVAVRFVDAVERTLENIRRQPSAGSPRYQHLLGLPHLRSRQCGSFPYLVFYEERAEDVDVWRVIHAKRDIPNTLTGL